ncbi:MAG: hypothetical protein BA872_06250 [Desulfobacterales bacterium C00003060]|nr:MAG: hypothetical protein BA872_06250 [Desulfobacterales bacterium C00003060]
MRKVIFVVLGLFFLIAVLLGAGTFWLGLEAKQQYNNILQQASTFQNVYVSNESYSRGFLRSQARTGVEIRTPGACKPGEEPLRFTLVHDIRHGPLPLWESLIGEKPRKPALAIIETQIELSPETQSRLKKAFGEISETPTIINHTTFFLGGNGESQLVIPAFQQTIGKVDKVTVDWKGLTSNVAFDADFKTFTGSLSASGLETFGKDGKLGMEGIESAFNVHEVPSGLFLGDVSLDVSLVEFSGNGNGQRFSINDLQMKTSSQASNDTINYSMAMRIEQTMADDTAYGPGGYELQLRKLDAASLAKLQRVAQEVQTQFPQQPADQITQMMIAKYAQILPDLLKKSPEIEITQLSLNTNDGAFTGKAKIVFDGTNAATLNNPLLLLNAVTAHAEFTIADRLLQRILESISKKEIIAANNQGKGAVLSEEEISALAAVKTAKRLETLVEKNSLVHEHGNYKASADYRQGQVILNGRPVTLQELVL